MLARLRAPPAYAQFQNKYAAQRALLRDGEQLTPGLVVGVKPVDARHRAAIEQYDSSNDTDALKVRCCTLS